MNNMEKILILDNYDSFTYNILHIINDLGYEADVFRNDKITIKEIDKYDKIILSPGPGVPKDAGVLMSLIKEYSKTKSILGICLGEQAIGEVFGAKLENLKEVYHGTESEIEIVTQCKILKDISNPFKAGRYHSWVISKDNFPSTLEIIAIDKENGNIMGIKHKEYDVMGVQFHPESVLTPEGKSIIKNWITL